MPAGLPDDLVTLCRAASLLLPDDAWFSHLTAAQLYDLPLTCHGSRLPLHVTSKGPAPRIEGVAAHRSAVTVPTGRAFGLPVSSPASTWSELAESLGVDDLVVVGDHLLRRRLASRRALEATIVDRAGRRGVRRLQRALPLLVAGADSPMETRLRLLLVRAGLPIPYVNRDVVEDGAWLARPDLSYPAQRIAIEYEGDQHRSDRRQWKSDKTRRRLLEDVGWLVIEVIDDDVYRTPELTVARVRAALAARRH
ncbi:MAG: DUF559 domain-containing protein [Angustibacter sp.]